MVGLLRKCLITGFIVLLSFCFFICTVYSGSIETIIRVGYDGNLPPFQFTRNSKLVGFHVDLIEEIAKKYNYKIEYIPVSGNKKFADALRNNEIDIVLGICPSSDPEKGVLYSDGISESYITIVAGNSIAKEYFKENKQRSYIASVEMNTVSYSLLTNMGKTCFFVQKNQKKAFEKFISGESDILIGVRDSVIYQLDQINATNDYKIINNYIETIRYYIAVNDKDKVLLHNINVGLQELRLSGEYDEIRNKWINEKERIEKQITETVLKFAVVIFAAIATIILFNVRLNRLLKLQVAEKTKEISSVNSDLKQKIIEIRETNEIRSKVVDQSPSAIIVMDRNLNITLFNEKAKELTGIKKEPIGKNALTVNLISKILKDRSALFQSGAMECMGAEIRIQDNKEDDKIYRYDIYSLYTEVNEIRGAILIVDDVTEEIELKKQTYEREKNRVLNQIVAEIAHEILNPLTSIKTLVELVPQKREDLRFHKKFSEIVPAEVDRINVLLRNLLDYAKPPKDNKVCVSISSSLSSCAELIRPMIAHEKMEICTEMGSEQELFIYTDDNQFKQVLLNLMINSVESMKESLQDSAQQEKFILKIKANGTAKYVYITIEDQGGGMTPEQLKNAVNPFYTTKSSGSGLGLAIAKRFVEENQGSMQIESRKNAGTSITLRFPACRRGTNNGKKKHTGD